jgi:hypothetical protein
MKKYTVAKIERVLHDEIKKMALKKQRGIAEEANRIIRLGLALDSCADLNRVRKTLEQRYSWPHMTLTDFIDTALVNLVKLMDQATAEGNESEPRT